MSDYPVITTGSKIGIHSLRPKNCLAHIRALQQQGGRFPVVKAVDDLDWLIEVKQVDAQIVTLARLTSPDEGLQFIERETDFDRRVEYLMRPILNKLAARPELRQAVDYWEICNEPDPPGVDGYRMLALCMQAAMVRAEAEGLKLALFAFNAGTPEWWEMQALTTTGVFGRARAGGHILSLHEGVFRHPIQGWIDPIDLWWNGAIPANPEMSEYLHVDGAGPLCFRYRYLYQLLAARDEIVPLVVSEIVYGGGYAQDGGSEADTVARARWYDEQASLDYYLLGHLPFTLGSSSSDGDEWRRRDYEFAYPALVAYMAGVKDRPNALPLSPAPPPVDAPGLAPPVTPIPAPLAFPLIVNLLPPGATPAQRQAIVAQSSGDPLIVVDSAEHAQALASLGAPGSLVKVWSPSDWAEDVAGILRAAGLMVETLPWPT